MKAINIQWDLEDMEWFHRLPTEMEIPDDIDEDEIADYLSDETGLCHLGFDLIE